MATEILIVDDEADIRVLTSGILQDEGFQTREAANSTEALGAVEARRPNLVLLDIWLQGSELDGLGILKALKQDHPTIPVLMMSGHGTIETAVSAIQDGAYDFIEKPFKADRLILLVERAIEADRLRRENEELRIRAGTANELIGLSQATRDIKQSIDQVAPSNSRILITGPAGSGKEVVARMLHAQSRRAEGPFVVVNCATMSPDRFEVELFGTENPDADGNAPQKVGTFEAAHNGTLFLDEVADMPLETQGKIVRVLQEQIFERVDGSVRVEVDVRVIASSTVSLADEISAAVSIPLLHIADASGDEIRRQGWQRAGLLGTRFTMEETFYRERLAYNLDVEILIPSAPQRETIHRVIYTELCEGRILAESRDKFSAIVDSLTTDGAQGIVLGCTEIGLLLRGDDVSVPLLDSTHLHARAAVEWALK